MTRAWRILGVCLTASASLALGCSGEETHPSGAPMAAVPTAPAPTGVNRVPVISSVRLDPDEPLPGGRVHAVVQATDPDGGPVQLRYIWTLRGAPVSGESAELALDQAKKGDEVEVKVFASDGKAESEPMSTRTFLGNSRPNLFSVKLEPTSGLAVGGSVKAIPDARDADDDELQFQVEWLVNGSPIPETELVLEGKSLRRGDKVQARVRASDGAVTTDAVTSNTLEVGNSPPKIVSLPATKFENGVFVYTVEAKDPDGERNLHFSLVKAPEGMTIDRLGGEIRWQPTLNQTGKHTVEVAVEDSQGGKDGQQFELTIGKESAPSPAAQAPAAPAP
jgi:hypothetical protein